MEEVRNGTVMLYVTVAVLFCNFALCGFGV